MSATEPWGLKPLALYQRLVDSRVTEHLNDASLCIREMHLTNAVVYPDDLDDGDEEAINDAAHTTIRFLTGLIAIWTTAKPAYNRHLRSRGLYEKDTLHAFLHHSHKREHHPQKMELRRLFHRFAETLNSTFVLDSACAYIYDLHRWAELLLSLAEDLEALQGDLRKDENELTAGFASLSLSNSTP
jgi:hypothetical protein